jgi:hypothetical protein
VWDGFTPQSRNNATCIPPYHGQKRTLNGMAGSTTNLIGLDINGASWAWSWTLNSPFSFVFFVLVCVAYWGSTKFFAAVEFDYSKVYTLSHYYNRVICIASLVLGGLLFFETFNSGSIGSWHAVACKVTPNSGRYGMLNLIFLGMTILKGVDNYILGLQGRIKVAMLTIHHMTAFMMAALTHNFPIGEFCWMHCLVSASMYAYFADPEKFSFLKNITICLQVLSFLFMFSAHTYAYLQGPGECFDLSPVEKEWWVCEGIMVVHGLLFLRYVKKKFYAEKTHTS